MNFQTTIASIAMTTSLIVYGLFITTPSYAQFTIGIKASTPTLSAKEATKEYFVPKAQSKYNLTYVSTRSSYAVGLTFYKDLKFSFLMADLLYRKIQVDYKLDMFNHLGRESAILNDHYRILSVPIVAGYQKKNFKIGVGPVFNIKIDTKYGLSKYEGFNIEARKINKAVQFVIGYKIKNRIHVDLRHELSLDAEGDDYNIVGNPLKIYSHPQSFSVSVGFYL